MLFWTFFSATAIGKAIIKVHGQTAFVITIFNVQYLESLLDFLARFLSPGLHETIKQSFHKQRSSLHRKPGDLSDAAAAAGGSKNILSSFWDMFLGLMIGYFVVSIVNSLAQGHQAMIDEVELFELENRETKRLSNASSSASISVFSPASSSKGLKPRSPHPKTD